MFAIMAVTRNGPMRSTPYSPASSTSRIIVLMPPIPDPTIAPLRPARSSSTIGFGRPASRIASAVAAHP